MGLHLALEERLDALGERHALGVAQLRVGLGVAVLVAADGGRLVALGEGGEDRLPGRGRELDAGLLRGGVEQALELVAVLDERAGQRAHELADRLLQRAPFGLLLRARGALLLRLRQRLEALLLFEAGDALRRSPGS